MSENNINLEAKDQPSEATTYGGLLRIARENKELSIDQVSSQLRISPDQIEALLQRADLPYRSGDIKGLYLNFRFDGTRLLCTTGTSFHTFVQDKSLEHLWDGTVMKLFASKGLEFEENS